LKAFETLEYLKSRKVFKKTLRRTNLTINLC
jgi:hypothetical protein